jgi:hypothetical protein
MKLVIIHNAAGEILVLGRVARPDPKGPGFAWASIRVPGNTCWKLKRQGNSPKSPSINYTGNAASTSRQRS